MAALRDEIKQRIKLEFISKDLGICIKQEKPISNNTLFI
jgi:hypothetical protein